MIVFPNAKINLGLRITRRRPDGYHDIESLMVPIAWRDILEVVPSTGPITTLTVTGRNVDCPPESNLVMKAFRALEKHLAAPLPPLDIYLRKIIPDGAGMGGGSADASFALRAINAQLRLGLSDSELAKVAATVGADCPFFIYNKVSEASGTGTTLTYAAEAEKALRRLKMTIAIAKPAEGVSTREAYASIMPRPLSGLTPAQIVATLAPEEWQAAGLVNDFEQSVMTKCPSVRRALNIMSGSGAAYSSMTGSGSAVFGLFHGMNDNLSAELEESLPGCAIFVAPLLAEED
ncbi:MAG: 4-(cytidine 5'-diphospho)-2-C-methyl-D-erythritol kinase [Bacteroides sp.]|nr:4-(cytidine 5'-diphospho)-2-C-methyl-D-erythritol kinase [Bacteroides sp.]